MYPRKLVACLLSAGVLNLLIPAFVSSMFLHFNLFGAAVCFFAVYLLVTKDN